MEQSDRPPDAGCRFDANEVMGWSDESIFNAGAHLRDTIAGGRQRTAGVYGQDIIRITPKWIATIGGRFDHWRNFDAESVRTPDDPPSHYHSAICRTYRKRLQPASFAAASIDQQRFFDSFILSRFSCPHVE